MTTPIPTQDFLVLQRAVAGRYSLDRELGRGGMGVVFLARDVALDRLIAIKLLPPALATMPELRTRFLREARTAAQLSHPHIVAIHAVEEHGALVFFVMAYIEGETLGQRVRRAGPLPSHDLLRVIQETSWALGHAHARGLVHRDVKPDNILLERDSGRALVTDFGIARAAVASADSAHSQVAGTPQYMSPEQAAGADLDHRSDLYSLGVTAFFAATGRLPFEAASVAGLLMKHAGATAPPLASVAPRLPPRFTALVDRCLAKDPDARPSTADVVADEAGRAGGALIEAPAAIRAFLREHAGAGTEIGMALTGAAVSVALYGIYARDLFAGYFFLPVSAVLGGLALARFGQAALAMRDLRREGYGFAALRAAVELEQRRREEDTGLDPQGRRLRVRSAIFYGAIGAAKTALMVWLAGADVPLALNVIGAAGAVGIPALTVRKIWTDLRRGRRSLWERFLGSGFARGLYRALGTGVRKREIPAAGEPTALAVGRAADVLFEGLPPNARAHLHDLPQLIARLEADALGAGDGERRRTAIAALEGLRLELWRLHAGHATLDDLTADLDRARDLATRVDDLLEARQEVAQLLEEDRPATG